MEQSAPTENSVVTLQAAKWQEIPMLVSVDEMKRLLEGVEAHLFFCSGVCHQGEESCSVDDFLAIYGTYLEALVQGLEPIPLPAFCWTRDLVSVAFQKVGEEKTLVKPVLPLVFLKPHTVGFSPIDGKFRSHVFGPDTISWGVSFAYPTLYIDPVSRQPRKVESDRLNTQLFAHIRQFSRAQTTPTPFEYQGKRIKAPIRLGKQMWIQMHAHPGLQKHGLRIDVDGTP